MFRLIHYVHSSPKMGRYRIISIICNTISFTITFIVIMNTMYSWWTTCIMRWSLLGVIPRFSSNKVTYKDERHLLFIASSYLRYLLQISYLTFVLRSTFDSTMPIPGLKLVWNSVWNYLRPNRLNLVMF